MRKRVIGSLALLRTSAFESEASQFLSLRVSDVTATPREAVSRAYREDREAIYRYLVALGTDPADAQDITQEVFLRLYESLRQRKQIRNFRAWTFAVASNLALNHKRAQTYRLALHSEPFLAWQQSRGDRNAADPEQTLVEKMAVYEAIQTLSAQQRVCLHLRAEGFRYREIAEIVGVSTPTVGEFLRRAIARLKEVIHG